MYKKSALFGTAGAYIDDRKAVNVMTVLLVLGTFMVFIVLDYALNRRKALQTVSVQVPAAAAVRSGSEYVDGFLVPSSVSYHSGHGWLVRERQNVVRMGADEFAAARPSLSAGRAGARPPGRLRLRLHQRPARRHAAGALGAALRRAVRGGGGRRRRPRSICRASIPTTRSWATASRKITERSGSVTSVRN